MLRKGAFGFLHYKDNNHTSLTIIIIVALFFQSGRAALQVRRLRAILRIVGSIAAAGTQF